MAENELVLPLQNLAFLCKRYVPLSIPALQTATIQLSFPGAVDSKKASCECFIPGGFGLSVFHMASYLLCFKVLIPSLARLLLT